MQPLSKLVEAVVTAVAGQAVAVPAGVPHQTWLVPQVCDDGDVAITALTTAAAAASAAVCAASRRKYAHPISTTRLIIPSITNIETVAIIMAWPLRGFFSVA